MTYDYWQAVESGRAREDAVRALTQAGWTPQEIAYVLRWKLRAVELILKRAQREKRAAECESDVRT
jgi:hypothetical protein